VRRVLEHLGLEVSRLLRTSYGPFELLDLPRGAAVEIRQIDVERFVKSLRVPSGDGARPSPEQAHLQARNRVNRARPGGERTRRPEGGRPAASGAKPRPKPGPRK